MKHIHITLLCITLVAASAGPASAHVTLEEVKAQAGKPYKATLRVSHGCEGTATHTLRVRVPAGFRGAKPMPKPGWTLQTQRAPLAQPYESHGRRITDDVVEITWTAATREAWLADAHYDEFVLRGQLPAQPGPLWFKVQQLCEKGQWDWFDTPADPKSTSRAGLKAPAALLEVLPAEDAQVHRH
jgi:periplasmic copper chaperone A